MLDWCYTGQERFTDPFFENTIDYLLQHPFNVLFRKQTEIEILEKFCATADLVKPTGFIFHMSHCGSTLVSRMFAALERNVVVSEPGMMEIALRTSLRHRAFSDEQRIILLRWIISALGQRHLGSEDGYFVKFDSIATLDLHFIRQAFPDVPWIFVYRDPIPVMVSVIREPGGKDLPGAVDPSLFDLDTQTVMAMGLEEYTANITRKICQSALTHIDDNGLLINYTQLPEVVWSELLPFFDLNYSHNEIESLQKIASFNAKDPSIPFEEDTQSKHKEASDAIKQVCEKLLNPVYQELENKRLSQFK